MIGMSAPLMCIRSMVGAGNESATDMFRNTRFASNASRKAEWSRLRKCIIFSRYPKVEQTKPVT